MRGGRANAGSALHAADDGDATVSDGATSALAAGAKAAGSNAPCNWHQTQCTGLRGLAFAAWTDIDPLHAAGRADRREIATGDAVGVRHQQPMQQQHDGKHRAPSRKC